MFKFRGLKEKRGKVGEKNKYVTKQKSKHNRKKVGIKKDKRTEGKKRHMERKSEKK